MKRLLRDACVLIVTVTGVSVLYRAFLRRRGPLVRVVVFHDVADGAWFFRTLATLCTRYRVLTPDEFTEAKFDAERINVLITFDDGYASWVDVCLPALTEHNVRALFFVNSGMLDAESKEAKAHFARERLLLTKPHGLLSWEGARALARAGHTIGGHTRSHARMSELSVAEQEAEIRDDRTRLAEMLGTLVTTFAYPFGNAGDYTEDTARIVRETGYTHAFTTEGVFAEARNQYALSRLCIEDDLSPRALRRWVGGGYDVYGILKKLCVR